MRNDINDTFADFRACCDDAPAGTFTLSREVRELIGEAVDTLARKLRPLGITPCNSDGAHNVEATIYAWIAAAKNAPHEFASAEGFGRVMNHGDRDTKARVIAATTRNYRQLAALKAGQREDNAIRAQLAQEAAERETLARESVGHA